MKTVKASAAKSNCKPPPGDEYLVLDLHIGFYSIKDVDKTKEGEETEILVIHDSSLKSFNQNLIKRKLSYIDMFDHEGPAVICAIRDLTVGVFKHIEIISYLDIDKRIKYTKHILSGTELKKYKQVISVYK